MLKRVLRRLRGAIVSFVLQQHLKPSFFRPRKRFGILADGLVSAAAEPIVVRQGRAMGRPSRITVHLDVDEGTVSGCWVGGPVSPSDATVER